MKRSQVFMAAACILLTVMTVSAQRNLSPSSPVIENFDSLGTGSVNLTDNSTILGVYATRTTGNGVPNSLPANNGNTNIGSLYNMGATSSSDRALGTLSTNVSGTNHLGLRLVNSGTMPIGTIQVQYTGEQWRHGNGANETLTFEYQTGATVSSLTAGTWTSVPALNFLSPTNPPGQGPLDGNAPANRTTLTAAIVVNLPPGSEIMLRWTDIVDSAQPDGFGVDDLIVTAIAPSAAHVSVSGRVLDGYGRGISSAIITAMDMTGVSTVTYTNTFGYYSVKNLEAGQAYVLSVSARRHTFPNSSILIDLTDNLSGVNFVANR